MIEAGSVVITISVSACKSAPLDMNTKLGYLLIFLLAFATLSAACDHHTHAHGETDHHHGKETSESDYHHGKETSESDHHHGKEASGESAQTSAHQHHHHDHSSSLSSSSDYIIVFAAGASVPFISFLGNLACRYFKDGVTKFLPVLVSFGAGTMLASATVNFIPEAVAHTKLGNNRDTDAFLKLGLPILIGMLVSIIMEFVIHSIGGHHHDHDDLGFHDVEASKHKNHSEMQAMAWNMLIADAIHNTIDGVLIGTTFTKGIWQGLMMTMLIVFHELPQEIAELCILLHAGWPMRKAIIRNCVSTLTILIGVGIGLALAKKFEVIEMYCLAFIAGEFLYVSLGQLMPSLSRTVMTRRQTILSHAAFAVGILFICFLTLQFPHSHGHGGCSH